MSKNASVIASVFVNCHGLNQTLVTPDDLSSALSRFAKEVFPLPQGPNTATIIGRRGLLFRAFAKTFAVDARPSWSSWLNSMGSFRVSTQCAPIQIDETHPGLLSSDPG